MHTFDTPRPIDVTVDAVGDIRITAGEGGDTVVSVTPRTPDKAADIHAAEQVEVDLTGDLLTIKCVKSWRLITGAKGVADITIELPSKSRVSATTGMGAIVLDGELGRVSAKSAMGDITIDHMATGRAKTAFGDVRIQRVDGDLDVATASGTVRIGDVHGSAIVKNSNGNTTMGHVTGALKIKAANGRIDVEQVDQSTVCKTSNGSTRIGCVGEGDVILSAAAGDMEIGIPQGTAAWLSLNSRFGRVRNELDAAGGPATDERQVKVTATTFTGDVLVRRAVASAPR